METRILTSGRLGRYLRNAPIKRKLTTVFFAITCMTIVVFASIAAVFVHNTVTERQQRDVAGQLELLNQKLQLVIDTIEDISRVIARHPTTQRLLRSQSASQAQTQERYFLIL